MEKLYSVFNPRSVAIVGVSKDERKWGYICLKRLIEAGFEGDIYPIHPEANEILGKKVYPNLMDIEGNVDLVLIALGPNFIPAILEECIAKRVKAVIIIAAGFSESGEKGRKLEEEIVKVAKENKIRIVGPNCIGVYADSANLNVTGILTPPPKGKISLISQSGTISAQIFNLAVVKGFGFSNFVSIGNAADISFHECLEYMRNDPNTKCIIMYIEGIKRGKEFLKEVAETVKVKPIVAYKVGRSEVGKRVVTSHTGTMVGEDAIYSAVFKQAGIVRVRDSDKLLEVGEALANLPPMQNRNIAILSDGGGPAAVASDVADLHGLEVSPLSNKSQAMLRNILPHPARVENPVDIIDISISNYDISVFEKCARVCLEDEKIGGLVIVGPFGGYKIIFSNAFAKTEEDTAHGIGKLIMEYNKPIVLQSIFGRAKIRSLDILREYGIPVNESIETTISCIAALAEYGEICRK